MNMYTYWIMQNKNTSVSFTFYREQRFSFEMNNLKHQSYRIVKMIIRQWYKNFRPIDKKIFGTVIIELKLNQIDIVN